MNRRKNKKSYSEQMQRNVQEYRAAGMPWPATARSMARWMIKTKRWERGENAAVEVCAREISRAMREDYYTDPQGRRVRIYHAATTPAPNEPNGQMTLWHDSREAPRVFMVIAFKNRRDQIVGDCVRLSVDVESYNENKTPTKPIPMLWDFTEDVLESKQSGQLHDQESTDDDSNEISPPPSQSKPVVLQLVSSP